jgi:tetratricopeptide (TPR) repeat protein
MGDRVSEGYTLQCLAVVYRDTGREAEALAYAGDALAAGRDVGAWWTESDSVNLLGTVYHRLGRDSDAIDQHSRALRMAGENHDCRLEAEALIGLADIEHGDAADLARTRADRALAMARRYGYRLLEGAALVRLAAIHQSAGRAHQAGTLARQALAIHRESGHRLGQADALRVLGAALHDSGTTAAALECRQQELAILAQLDDSRAVSGGSHRPIEARAGRPDVP